METTKIVYNACFGGFGLSMAAMKRYAELAGYNFEIKESEITGEYYEMTDKNGEEIFESDLRRDDPLLAQVVEELGEEADTQFSELCIRELPKGTKYRIDEYDGLETVMTIDEYHWLVA